MLLISKYRFLLSAERSCKSGTKLTLSKNITGRKNVFLRDCESVSVHISAAPSHPVGGRPVKRQAIVHTHRCSGLKLSPPPWDQQYDALT